MENYNEKRKHPRLNLVWNIYRHNDNTLQHLGHIRNFSETGVLFASKLDLKKDDCFLINITVPEKLYPYIGVINLELDSQIVRVRDIKESAYFSTAFSRRHEKNQHFSKILERKRHLNWILKIQGKYLENIILFWG
jgi:hypothetical protein